MIWQLTMYDSWDTDDTGANVGVLAGSVQSWRDITDAPDANVMPSPNVVVVEVIATDAQLATLNDADIITQEEIV